MKTHAKLIILLIRRPVGRNLCGCTPTRHPYG